MLIDFLQTWLTETTDAFLDPRKRVFFGYLLAAFVVALVAMAVAQRGRRRMAWGRILRHLSSPRVWWHRSARADYMILILNRAAMMLIAPHLLTQMVVATALFMAMHQWFGGRPMADVAGMAWMVVGGFTLTQFLLDDLSKYLVHRALHRVSFLWPFHRVHHTAETLTPFTVYRTHPVEGVIFALRGALVQGVTIPVFVFFFGSTVDLATILGVNVALFLFNMAGSNLRHSHVSIRYGHRLEHLLISPAQHQIHHSLAPEHHDRNYGAVLAIWDWIGGSLVVAQRGARLRFGVRDGNPADPHSLYGVYVAPLAESTAALFRLMRNLIHWSRFMLSQVIDRCFATRLRRGALVLALAVCSTLAILPRAQAAGELDIYSHRQPFLIQPFIDAFSAQTGVKVNVVFASKGLAQRLLIEGKRSPADLVLTVDIGRLSIYADKDLLRQVVSETLNANIPAHLRDPGNRWFALSLRARAVAVSRDRVPEGSIKRIEDLADPKWRGRICTRPGSHVYNRALLASLIAANGEKAAEAWATGLVANLARRPQGNDRAQVKAIYEGQCDIAIINHYYFGKLSTSEAPEHQAWARSVRLVFTNQQDRGNHINISGGGVARHANNAEDAIRFLEFLTGDTAQKLYGTINTEYPVNPAVGLSDDLAEWGQFKADELPISTVAKLGPQAQRIIDRVGW